MGYRPTKRAGGKARSEVYETLDCERSRRAPEAAGPAVLPFENFSDNKENSYFAAGIQDDVLTSLAKIHELKVISRASVMAYQKPGGRNLREISQALGVANVLVLMLYVSSLTGLSTAIIILPSTHRSSSQHHVPDLSELPQLPMSS